MSGVTLGFIALTDSAPLIIAKEKGLFAKHGLPDMDISKQASWGAMRDNMALGTKANGIDGGDKVSQRGALDNGAVDAGVAAEVDVPDADAIVIVAVVGVVGKAVMLFLGVVQHQAQLHPLARQLAIGQAAHAGPAQAQIKRMVQQAERSENAPLPKAQHTQGATPMSPGQHQAASE